jgi:hypothetical protein
MIGNHLDATLQAFTRTRADFSQPAVNGTVLVDVASTAWMPVGLAVFLEGGGSYVVVSTPSRTKVKLRNTGATGNAAAGATVKANALLSPGSAESSGGGGGGGVVASPSVAPVDFVLTSNDSLSGLTARDGVSLVSSVTRGLATAQSTASQNGIWEVRAGAWVRPTDFATDDQVAQSAGQLIYVKVGGLTGGDTNWQLKSGTTIASAKAYGQIKLLASPSPVRAVQTEILTGWVYDNALGTLTAPSNGALTSPWFAMDSVTDPATGNRDYEVIYGSLHVYDAGFKTQAGVYTLTDGTVSTPAKLTRRTDLNTGSKFAESIAFEVTDGNKFRNARRQLTTQGAVTLGTTPIVFESLTAPNTTEIDLSKAPYYVKDYASYNEWSEKERADQSRKIHQFLWDNRDAVNGQGVVGVLPTSNGGTIMCFRPIWHWGGVTLTGNYPRISTGMAGGPQLVTQALGLGYTTDWSAQIKASPVDVATGSYSPPWYVSDIESEWFGVTTTPTALSTWRAGMDPAPGAGAPAVSRGYYWNLTDAGVYFNSWPNFQFDYMFSFEQLGTRLPLSHIASCRGRRTVDDGDDIASPCFTIFVDESVAPYKLTAKLRVTKPTGTYGATVQTGGGTATVTGSSTFLPTADAPNFAIKVLTGGTIGAPGCVITYTLNGYSWHAPIALGRKTGLTMVDFDNVEKTYRCACVSTANITLSGEQTIDGVLTNSSYVLVAGQSTGSQNGVYRSAAGAWSRVSGYSTDANFVIGTLFVVQSGTNYTDTRWLHTAGASLAASKTYQNVAAFAYDASASEQKFLATVNFGAGTLVAGTTYAIPITGCDQIITLTSNQGVTADLSKKWVITLMYDGTTVRFGVSEAGQPRDTSASMVTGAPATGVVRQRYWEHTMIGEAANYGSGESGRDFNATQGFWGSIRFLNYVTNTDGVHASGVTPVMPPATTPTSLGSYYCSTFSNPILGQGQKFFCRPTVFGTQTTPNNTRGVPNLAIPLAYLCETEANRGHGWLVTRSATTGAQFANGGYEDLIIDMGSDATARGMGILSCAWRGRKFKNLELRGGGIGWANVGPDFGSEDASMRFVAQAFYCMRFFQGSLNMNGSWSMADYSGEVAVLATAAAITCPSTWFINLEGGTGPVSTRCALNLDQMYSSEIGQASFDGENMVHGMTGTSIIRVNVLDGNKVKIKGGIFSVEAQRCITSTGRTSVGTGGQVIVDRMYYVQSAGDAGLYLPSHQYPPFSFLHPDAPVLVKSLTSIVGDGNALLTTALTDRPRKLVELGGTLGPTVLADAGPFPAFSPYSVVKLAADTLTANRSYTIPVANMQLGDTVRVVVESQATYTATFVNGGPAGGNVLPVIAAATDCTFIARLNEDGNLERV